MSKYTTEVRFYCETLAGYTESQDYDKIDSIVEKAAPQIFKSFPIWDESYRLVLETKILKHYYVREICAETPGLWKLWLNNRMNEIMPYYNQLYSSAIIKYDLLRDFDITTEHTGEGTRSRTYEDQGRTNLKGDTSTEAESQSKGNTIADASSKTSSENETTYSHLDRYSNTPQGSAQGPIFSEYLTDARDIQDQTVNKGSAESTSNESSDSESSSTSNSSTNQNQTIDDVKDGTENINDTDKYLEHTFGKRGLRTYPELIIQYRQTLINIDTMIINDLADLFFNLF